MLPPWSGPPPAVRRSGRAGHHRTLDRGGDREPEHPGQGEGAVHVAYRDHARGEVALRGVDGLPAQGRGPAGAGPRCQSWERWGSGPTPPPGSRRSPSRPPPRRGCARADPLPPAAHRERPAGSAPVIPTSCTSTKTNGLAASTREAGTVPTPSTSRPSTTLPDGSSAPVPAPPGSRNSRSTGAPVPRYAWDHGVSLDRRTTVLHRKAGPDELLRYWCCG